MKNFFSDLKVASRDAAIFLRGKHEKFNNGLLCGENEFVAECYTLLTKKNEAYHLRVVVNYSEAIQTEKVSTTLHPDLMLLDREGTKVIVEVKPVWGVQEGASYLSPWDKRRIREDYHKLTDKYPNVSAKILLVPFLGEVKDYDEDKFRWNAQKCIEKLVKKNIQVEVFTC